MDQVAIVRRLYEASGLIAAPDEVVVLGSERRRVRSTGARALR